MRNNLNLVSKDNHFLSIVFALVALPSIPTISFASFINRSEFNLFMFSPGDLASYSFSFYLTLSYCIAFSSFGLFLLMVVLLGETRPKDVDPSSGCESTNADHFERALSFIQRWKLTVVAPVSIGTIIFLFSFGKLTIEHAPIYGLILPLFIGIVVSILRGKYGAKISIGYLIAGAILSITISSGEMRYARQAQSRILKIDISEGYLCGLLLFKGSENLAILSAEGFSLVRAGAVDMISNSSDCEINEVIKKN